MSDIYFLNVAPAVVVVAAAVVVEATVGSVEIQRERERLTLSSVELQRSSS